MSPSREPRSDVSRFFAFLAGVSLVLASLGLALVIFLIVIFSASSEGGNNDADGEAVVVGILGAGICVGLWAGGVSLIGWSLRGRWASRGELTRWTGVELLLGFITLLSMFVVR